MIAQPINPTAGTATRANFSGVGLPESTTAQYISVAPKNERISAPRAPTFNWKELALGTLEAALAVESIRDSRMLPQRTLVQWQWFKPSAQFQKLVDRHRQRCTGAATAATQIARVAARSLDG